MSTLTMLSLFQVVAFVLPKPNHPIVSKCQSTHSTATLRIDKIEVKSVSFQITTWGRVECEQFDKQFPRANTKLIVDRIILDKLAQRISQLKPPIKGYSVDARARVIVYYSNRTQAAMCISGGKNMVFNGQLFKYEPSIGSLLGISTE